MSEVRSIEAARAASMTFAMCGETSSPAVTHRIPAVRARATTRRLILWLSAVAGVVATHTLDYTAVIGDAGERAEHLHATGHGYWTHAVALATSGAVLVVVAAAWCGARGARDPEDAGEAAIVRFLPLALAQVGLFAGMEVAERVLSGAGIAELAHGPLFAVGLLLQLVVAALAALLLGLVAAGAGRIASRIRRVRRPSPRTAAVAAASPVVARLEW